MASSLRAQNQQGRWDALKVWSPLALLVIAGFAAAYSTLDPPPPKTISLASGGRDGAYYAFAERYRTLLAEQGFELEIHETAGSIENLDLLHSGTVDLALVQGGTAGDRTEGLESLGTLFFEPLWVFQRAGLGAELLRDLEGYRVAIGPEGSGTRALALELLELNGIDGTATGFVDLGSSAAADALLAGEVDAAFFVSSARASAVDRLLHEESVELMSFRRFRAYDNQLTYLSPVILGQGAVDLEIDLPPTDVTLMASAASLVGTTELHHALIPLLLSAMSEVHGPDGMFAESRIFPSATLSELPLNAEAEQYLNEGPSFLYSFLPFRTAATLDRLKILLLPFITLLIPVFRVAPPLYRWRIRSRIYRWYEDLKLVDEILKNEPADSALEEHLEVIRELEQEVAEVQVPLSYMDEFYRLRVHIELILSKLERMTLMRDAAAKGIEMPEVPSEGSADP